MPYDFSKGKRGPVRQPRPEPGGKTRITIRLDDDIIDHFMKEADKSGGKAGYQSLINDALRNAITAPKLEEMVRKAVREEMRRDVA